MKAIIVLGDNSMNRGIIETLRNRGYKILLIDYREKLHNKYDIHVQKNACDVNIVEQINFSELEICGVYTSMDDGGLIQRALCKKFNLNFADESAMVAAHRKDIMHDIWKKNHILNRFSISKAAFSVEEVSDLNSHYDLIIKPSDSCASRGISVIPKESDELTISLAIENAKQSSKCKIINVEEYISGQEYTVEMLGDNFGNVAIYGISKKYHSSHTKNRIATKLHYNPNDMSNDDLLSISAFAKKCYKSLGLKNTLGHLELMRKKDGTFSPIEIGARSSGYIASNLADVGTERIYIDDYITVLNNGMIKDGLVPHNKISGMYFFYDIPPHKAQSRMKTNIMKFLPKEISSVYYDRSKLIPGMIFNELTQDTDRVGYEVLIGSQDVLTIDNVKSAETHFLKEFLYEKVI